MTRTRLVLLAAATALLALMLASQASAAITLLPPANSESAEQAGDAILETPGQLTGAEFSEYASSSLEPAATPAGIGDLGSPLTGFPTNGATYAILSSGNVELIATDTEQNYPESETFEFGTEFAPSPIPRGEANDWTVLRLNVNVPSGDNCLALDYRFLSEEYPVFVGSEFNDAFLAEMNANSWSVGFDGALNRGADFAASPTGEPISVNGVGPTAMSPAEAEGTYFNAATGLITTKTPIAAGPNSIYLSIFDASDERLDSAVFLDNLRFIDESATTCQPPVGAQLAIPVSQPGPTVTTTPPPPPPPSSAFTLGSSVKFKGGSEATLSVTVPGPGMVSAGSTSTAAFAGSARDTAVARAAATKGKAKGKKKKPVLLPASVTATGAGTVTLTLKLSATGKKALAKRHKLNVPVTVTFTPTGGTPASQKTTLVFKPSPKKHHK